MKPGDGFLQVLMAEDSPTDTALALAGLEDAGLPIHLHTVVDDVEALEFLRRQSRFAGAPRPDLVLLDLHMPRKNGDEVLREMRADAELAAIPVFVLTSPGSESVLGAHPGDAPDGQLEKPIDFARLAEIARSIGEARPRLREGVF